MIVRALNKPELLARPGRSDVRYLGWEFDYKVYSGYAYTVVGYRFCFA